MLVTFLIEALPVEVIVRVDVVSSSRYLASISSIVADTVRATEPAPVIVSFSRSVPAVKVVALVSTVETSARTPILRLPVVVTLDALDEDALVDILTQPKNALVKQYQKLMDMDGSKLTFEDEALRLIAKEAIRRKTGARGLRSILEKIMRNVMFEVPSVGGNTLCTVTKEDVLFNQEPKLRVNPKRTKRTANN